MSELLRQRIPYCGAEKENERCPNVFVRSFGIHKILLSEVEQRRTEEIFYYCIF